MANFLKVANTVKKNLNTKYHNGEFADPAVDAYKEDWVWLWSQWTLTQTIIKGIKLAPFLLKDGCHRPHINIKLFEKHLQIYRKSNRMYHVTINPVGVLKLIEPHLH